MKHAIAVLLVAVTSHLALAKEFHVSPSGYDTDKGSRSKPFRTISAAARVAQPGDVITVHGGVYRERITPPRGQRFLGTR
jgi:alpha-N-arabinofuranosidase